MSTIAFIGLGIMGSPMARHLIKAGYTVIGLDTSPERTAAVVEAGGKAAESIEQAVKDADVVAIMVPDSPQVQSVLLGDDGVFAHAQPGTLVIDFSSIRPDVTAEFAKIGKPSADCASSTRRCPAASPARRTPHCRSWSVAPKPTSPPPSRFSTRSARPSCTSAPTVRVKP